MTTHELIEYIKFTSVLLVAVGITIGGISAIMWAYNKLGPQPTEVIDHTDYNKINLDTMEAIKKDYEERRTKQNNSIRTEAKSTIRL